MPNLIDENYFNGALTIGQMADNLNDVKAAIDDHEPTLLLNLFGYVLYKDFVANIGATRHVDIINGKEYTDLKGDLTKWPGLKFTSGAGATKKSLIANYVYYWYTRNNTTKTSGGGETVQNNENSKTENPRFKLARAWNEMVEWNKQLRDFLLSNVNVYPEYVDPLRPFRGRIPETLRQDLFEMMNPYL